MYCVGARRGEVDWDALWKKRTREMARKYREEHREEINERKRKHYEEHKEQMREYNREYYREYNAEHREHRNEIVRRSQRKRRAEAVKNGLCCQCCRGVPEPGRKSCPKCLERAREAARKKRKSSI